MGWIHSTRARLVHEWLGRWLCSSADQQGARRRRVAKTTMTVTRFASRPRPCLQLLARVDGDAHGCDLHPTHTTITYISCLLRSGQRSKAQRHNPGVRRSTAHTVPVRTVYRHRGRARSAIPLPRYGPEARTEVQGIPCRRNASVPYRLPKLGNAGAPIPRRRAGGGAHLAVQAAPPATTATELAATATAAPAPVPAQGQPGSSTGQLS